MDNTYKVYALPDEAHNITSVNSSAFLPDVTGWVQIDEGTGDKYHHAQGIYFDKSLVTDDGIYRYKLINGVAVEKTESEIAAEVEALPPPQTAPETALMSMVIDHEFRIIMMEMGV